ncbi:hypothetical protein BELL_0385g00160 [Botrytis elliptica]|uniref:NmrA-like domain-containing protein n=1 Tax=Botrytis elliptica TaxID=278938 RepID=A0A4Z1JHH9_9HELO|nr:hypothetical protein BELL_0385g00160 [Botrytis elliptica]
MAKSVFIAAATGEQGRPLSILLLQLGYKVQILVRVSSSSAAQALRVLGAEVHTGNLASFEVVARAISGADTIYLALPPNLKNEILYAKNVLEATQQEKHASRPHQRWDIARFTTKVIQSPNRYSKKNLTLAAEKLSAAEIADRLGALSGKEITVEYLPDLVARALRKQGNEVVGA